MTPEIYTGLYEILPDIYKCDKPNCFFCSIFSPKPKIRKIKTKGRFVVKWTKAEEGYLRHNWNLLSLGHLAVYFKKSEGTIVKKADDLKLGRKAVVRNTAYGIDTRATLNDNFKGWF